LQNNKSVKKSLLHAFLTRQPVFNHFLRYLYSMIFTEALVKEKKNNNITLTILFMKKSKMVMQSNTNNSNKKVSQRLFSG